MMMMTSRKRKTLECLNNDSISTMLGVRSTKEIQSVWHDILSECAQFTIPQEVITTIIFPYCSTTTFASALDMLSDVNRVELVKREMDQKTKECLQQHEVVNQAHKVKNEKEEDILHRRYKQELDKLFVQQARYRQLLHTQQYQEYQTLSRELEFDFGSAWVFLRICWFARLPYSAAQWMAQTFEPRDCVFSVSYVQKEQHWGLPNLH